MNVAGHNLYLKGQYGDLDSSCISYGPCQTPTLGFCVSRHDQISSFKPEKYWRISLSVKTKFGSIATEWSRGRIFDNGVANLFFNRVKKGKGKFLLLYLRTICDNVFKVQQSIQFQKRKKRKLGPKH